MGWYGASYDGDVTRTGCGDRFCLEGSECDTAMSCCCWYSEWRYSGGATVEGATASERR